MANKRVSLNDRLRGDKLGVDALFVNPEASTSGQVDKAISPPKPQYTRRTFHIRPDQVKAIRRYSYEQELDISEVVRRALDAFLPRS